MDFSGKNNLEKELCYFDCLKDTMDSFLDIWYFVKKKYKLNVNFFHNTILNQQLILNSSTRSNTYPHIHLVRDSHSDCVSF